MSTNVFGHVPADLLYKSSVCSVIIWECTLYPQSQGLRHLGIFLKYRIQCPGLLSWSECYPIWSHVYWILFALSCSHSSLTISECVYFKSAFLSTCWQIYIMGQGGKALLVISERFWSGSKYLVLKSEDIKNRYSQYLNAQKSPDGHLEPNHSKDPEQRRIYPSFLFKKSWKHLQFPVETNKDLYLGF